MHSKSLFIDKVQEQTKVTYAMVSKQRHVIWRLEEKNEQFSVELIILYSD